MLYAMNWKALLAVATLVLLIYSPTWVPAASRTLRKTGHTREEIRAMPIHDRPNRVGHVYGNTVRRLEPRK
jgi:hypothetical protein